MRVMKVDKVSKASLDEMEHGSRKRVAGCNTMCPFYECYEREHSKGLDWVETVKSERGV